LHVGQGALQVGHFVLSLVWNALRQVAPGNGQRHALRIGQGLADGIMLSR
jgi:hypothetical protein